MSGGSLGADGFWGLGNTVWTLLVTVGLAVVGGAHHLWRDRAARRPDVEVLKRDPRPSGSYRAPWTAMDSLAEMEHPETEVELDVINHGSYPVHLEKTFWFSDLTAVPGAHPKAYDLAVNLEAGSSHTLKLTVPKRLIDGQSGGLRIYFTSHGTRRRRHYLFVPIRLGSWDDIDVPGPRLYGRVFLDVSRQKVARNQKPWMAELNE